MQSQFIRVHDKFIRLDAIAYVDFLESGRSMIFVSGLNQEKQQIAVDEKETRRIRPYIESLALVLGSGLPSLSRDDEQAPPLRNSFARAL